MFADPVGSPEESGGIVVAAFGHQLELAHGIRQRHPADVLAAERHHLAVLTGVAAQLGAEVEKRINKDVRVTVLGHVQRGGIPTAYDRVLATRFGVNAADAAHAGEYGQMVSLRGQDIGRVPLADAVRQLKLVPESRYDDAAAFFG